MLVLTHKQGSVNGLDDGVDWPLGTGGDPKRDGPDVVRSFVVEGGLVDVHADADDSGPTTQSADGRLCFDEDAADFTAFDEDIVRPLEMRRDAELCECVRNGERRDKAQLPGLVE